ncbi:baseplate J/gp47 family protein [Agarivorans sp. B2Z047]|uniref:baseplate J/gp47 family protein n=1 Tax=Agarivorans sp. B2Z047 TaxID=2652721 RepID=UPI0018841A7B|nr:baseplate J/gp47 family protein [Agarivorans sp. B2Z047]
MAYISPSLEDLIKQGELDIETHLDGSQPRLPFSVERAINFAQSALVKDLHDRIDYVSRQIVPGTENSDSTIIYNANRRGIQRKSATKAQGSVSFVAEVGTNLPAGREMQRGDGVIYITLSNTQESGGVIVADVEAQRPNSESYDGNVSAGVTVKLITPADGIASSGETIEPGITGGVNEEPIEALLERLIFQMRYPPQGGAEFDYVRWALEVPGVTRAWTYPTWYGLGTVGLTFVRDFDDPKFPNEQQKAEVEDYIYRHFDPATNVEVGRPITAELIMLDLVPKELVLTIGGVDDATERAAIAQELALLELRLIVPGYTLPLTQVQGAITRAGVYDYTLDLGEDTPSSATELITFGDIVWE